MASSFIEYPNSNIIFLNDVSSLFMSGSILSTIALYFLASSFAPSVSCFRTSILCISHTGPLAEYIIFPNIGIFLIHTINEPIIFLLLSSASITSLFQLVFTFAHSSDCWKLHLSLLSKNLVYSSSSDFVSNILIFFILPVLGCIFIIVIFPLLYYTILEDL